MNYFKKTLIPILLLCMLGGLYGQEKAAIHKVIQRLETGIQTKDTALLASVLLPDAQLTSLIEEEGKSPKVMLYTKAQFLRDFSQAVSLTIEEKMHNIQITINGNFASATADYSFYVNKERTHCGINYFHFYRKNNTWKIASITDTRQKNNCAEKSTTSIKNDLYNFVEKWHTAAAHADEETFFGMMAADGIYIGTDETEYWLRDELRSWAKSAFEKEVAWDFKTISRNIYCSDDGRTAWWDEKLDTWMGTCRGSGVLYRTSNGWKIKHYHLAVTIPNNKIKGFIKLVNKGKKK